MKPQVRQWVADAVRRRGVALLLLIVGGVGLTQAQPVFTARGQVGGALSRVAVDSTVSQLFDNQDELVWLRHFSGRFDDACNLEADLGFDGRRIRGWAWYPSSGARFRVDGPLSGSTFNLEERDSLDVVCGNWRGTFSNTQLNATWSNATGTVAATIGLEETTLAPVDNKWLNRYVARWNNTWAELVLFRSNNGALYGNLYLQADAQTAFLKGDLEPNGRYLLEAPLPGGLANVELSGQMRYLQSTESIWHASNGERRQFKFLLKDNLLTNHYEWADYRSSLDVQYPRTTCASCNLVLDRWVRSWADSVRQLIQQRPETATPLHRNAFRASGWAEITCWTDDLLSGYLLFDNSWGGPAKGYAFTFDLNEDEPVDLKSLFVKNFNYTTWLADYARRESPKMPGFAQYPPMREWLAREGFPLISVAREGLCLSTYFHPIYGQQHIVVPFSTLQPYLRKDQAIRRLYD